MSIPMYDPVQTCVGGFCKFPVDPNTVCETVRFSLKARDIMLFSWRAVYPLPIALLHRAHKLHSSCACFPLQILLIMTKTKNVSYIDSRPTTPCSLAWLVAWRLKLMVPDRLWYYTHCVVRGCPFSCTGPASCPADLQL